MAKPMPKKQPQWGRPPLLELNPNNIIGNVPFELPLYTSDAVVSYVLRDELADNSPKYPLWRDGFEQDLANQGGLLGLGVYFGPESATTKIDGMGEYPGPDTPRVAMSGLAAAKKVAKVAVQEKQPTVDVTMPQPIKTSTIYAVAGGAAVLILGSVALWAWYKGKKK